MAVFIDDKIRTAKDLLGPAVEQVRFIEGGTNSQELMKMMGGELCINATLAYAFELGMARGRLYLQNGQKVSYSNSADFTTISLNLPYRRMSSPDSDSELILFENIGYEIGLSEKEAVRCAENLPKLCKKLGLPAFGFIVIEPKSFRIKPLVYVDTTGTMVWETACGSGSIAVYIVKTKGQGRNYKSIDIIQPTGSPISVRQYGKQRFEISTKVKRISLNTKGKYNEVNYGTINPTL